MHNFNKIVKIVNKLIVNRNNCSRLITSMPKGNIKYSNL